MHACAAVCVCVLIILSQGLQVVWVIPVEHIQSDGNMSVNPACCCQVIKRIMACGVRQR